MTRISGFQILTRQCFKGVLLRSLAVGALMVIFTFALLFGSVNMSSFLLPYEVLIQSAGLHYVFLGGVAVLMLLMILQIHNELFKYSGYAVVMTLPVPRRHVFLAYGTAGALGILMLWTVQTLSLVLAYGPVVGACERAAAAYQMANETVLPFAVARTNGLFLAVIRGNLFHVLLPMSVPEAVNSLLLMLMTGCLPAYATLGEHKRAAVATTIAAIWLLDWTVSQRVDMIGNMPGFIWSTVLTGLALAYMIVTSVCRLNRHANLV